jgi:hypothetical protein
MCSAKYSIHERFCAAMRNMSSTPAAAMLFYRKPTSMLFFIPQQLLSGRNGLQKFHPYLNISLENAQAKNLSDFPMP